MLPKWAFGYHLSRFSYDNQSWVQYLADTAASSNIPLDAVYLDIDYMNVNADGNPTAPNVLHQLTTNSKFPDPGGMVSYCGAKGVKIVPLIEPILETQDPMYSEANSLFHFIKDNNSAHVHRQHLPWPGVVVRFHQHADAGLVGRQDRQLAEHLPVCRHLERH